MNGDWSVLVWWGGLSSVALFNLGLWTYVFRRWLQSPPADRVQYVAQRTQFVLSCVFTAVCAFRSFLPRAEAQRIVLYDTWWSNAALGRSAATVAELCFMLQWALLLRSLAPPNAHVERRAAWVPVVLIAIAEVFSWYTALTTDFIGSVVEESLWLLASAWCIVGFFKFLPLCAPAIRRWLQLVIVVGLGYCAFLAIIDVPMYWTRWRADEARGHVPMSLLAGLQDSLQRWVVTRSGSDWYQEMPWMSLYFSVGVWMSIGLTQISWSAAVRRAREQAQLPKPGNVA